jgi:hypothetical protein
MSEIKSYQENLLKIEVKFDESEILIKWLGESKDREPTKFLTPIFDSIYTRNQTKPLVMDFTHFEYMNSSTVTPIVKQLERAKKENRKVTIQYKKGLKWQELSFAALKVFNIPGLIEVIGI